MESLLARLERRFGRHAPEGIILWIVGISGALHLLVFARPDVAHLLWLYPDAVLRGEVWRVVTFLFAPTGPVTGYGLLWTAIGLWFLHTMGSALEAQWGSFRFDLFFFLGALGTLAVGFALGPVPDFEVLLLILPVKVKYLGLFSGGLMVYALISGDFATQAAVAVALGAFLIFCGGTLRSRMRGARVMRPKVAPAFAPPPRKARVCAKCGKSDADDPNLEFRVCDCQERCHGKLTEYCLEHARSH
ncbi:MAG: hypothetical protein AUI90_08810 [Deltaproteobacteria bacterium 13_1_40CM_3_69_14]|nr:MAG: hypothetical protein AUI90_08810 [Deltaproteobacteria bacterium 13_1_40CM_3_69_14]